MKSLIKITFVALVAFASMWVLPAYAAYTSHTEIGVVCIADDFDLRTPEALNPLTDAAVRGDFEDGMIPVAEFTECQSGMQPAVLETVRYDGDPASPIDGAIFSYLWDVDADDIRADRLTQ